MPFTKYILFLHKLGLSNKHCANLYEFCGKMYLKRLKTGCTGVLN